MRKKTGQSLAEYTIVASLIAVVLATMGPGFRRSVQQVIKSVADVVGFQKDAEQASDLNAGFINAQNSNTRTSTSGSTSETQGQYVFDETESTNAQSITYTNGAFINQ